MGVVLDFEKPIAEIQKKIEELKQMSSESGLDMANQIKLFEKQAQEYKKELYSKLKPSQKIQIARHQERPKFSDYIGLMFEDFIELHGDRYFRDDPAIMGGIGFLDGQPVTVIGVNKGRDFEDCKKHNYDESLFCSILRQLDMERVQFTKNMEDFSEGQKKKVLMLLKWKQKLTLE